MTVTPAPSGLGLALVAALTLATIAAAVAGCLPRRPTLAAWVARRRRPGSGDAGHRQPAAARSDRAGIRARARSVTARWSVGARLAQLLRRAGLSLSPAAAIGVTLLATFATAGALVGAGVTGWVVVPAPLSALAVAAVPVAAAADIGRRGRRRRSTLLGQLPILADLMVLEQTGGGVGFRRALEEVVTQVGGLASDCLQACLSQSALAGGPHLDDRIDALAQEFELPALASLATVARLQRTEGAAVGPVLRQLASTLRDQQRDALLAAGKRQVIQMLLPTGLCILLPFIVLVLYPALARLAGALT
ncbi:MAG TPA: type II secretion system F family protein [Verrucomicrobiae bacterium]|nr:type II secretion system F family protein [Verrucomicrobiae bacterium]